MKETLWSKSKTRNEFKFSDDIPSDGPPPPTWNCQWKEWPLRWSMSSMRPHLKQSDKLHRFSHPDTPLTIAPNGHPHWFPRGEWPTWSKPGKWHKWAMQLFISMWHYLQWLFTNMYICHLITYSYTKSIKMLWGLFLPLTKLLISLHQQSSVSLHQGTTFIHSNFQKAFSDIPYFCS